MKTNGERPGLKQSPRRRAGLRLRAAAAACFLLAAMAASAQSWRDNFASRQLLTAGQGSLAGNNTGATVEPGEPRHGGKTGGHSLWISWLAPSNGVVKFQTEGSAFDTLLSAYHFPSTNGAALSNLVELARADDSEGFEDESEIKFGVLAGRRYEIAVDGYFGATGPLELEWDFEPTALAPPVILSAPGDRAIRPGEAVTLTVVLTNAANGTYRWYHNGEELDDADGTTLVLPGVQAVNVGRYKLRVTINGPDYYSAPIEIQINSDGAANALAQDKFLDALETPLTPGGGGPGAGMEPAGGAGLARGYNGAQIFNTTYATPDPNEPRHCGLNIGATYWYAYQPPADGTLMLDTLGSAFDTFLAVYTYTPPVTNYADLIPIACDNDSAGSNGAARLEFAAPRHRQFAIVVGGLNGLRGLVHLNYRLDTNRLPVAPKLTEIPAPRAVAAGTNVTLQPGVEGSEPLRFAWRKGANLLLGATNRALQLNNVAPVHSGDYFVAVSSHVGGPLNVLLPLRVLVSPSMQVAFPPGGPLACAFPSVAGQRYFLEHTAALGGAWQPWTNSFPGNGSVLFLTNAAEGATGFYRLRVE